MAGISEGEVAVYDRQLRLWGVQAQQRLLKAKVLIWGLEGCNIEVCKNLVLAGVSLVIRDHREVALADVAFNYFLRQEDLHKKRAECAAQRVQEMNPLAAVSSSLDAPEDAPEALREALKGFDVVCVALGVLGYNAAKAGAVDAVCREVNASFLLTANAGELALFFSNLHKHVVEEQSSTQGAAAAPVEPPPPPETLHFPSFQEWLECTPAALEKEKVDASVLLVALFLAFSRLQPGHVAPGTAAAFEDFCRTEAKCTPTVDGFEGLQEPYEHFFREPLVHVASVVGGLMAQEVIKAITKRDAPLVNTVCFNAHTSVALVERIPAEKRVAVKRKVEEVADLLD